MWSKQYLSAVHPVNCSLLWVRSLFHRFSISDFVGKWPLKWKFSKTFFRIPRRDTEIRFVTKFGGNRPLRVAERSSDLPHKKTWLRGTRPSPHFAKITWTLSPFDLSTYTEMKDWFFWPKKSLQYMLSAYKNKTGYMHVLLITHTWIVKLTVNTPYCLFAM